MTKSSVTGREISQGTIKDTKRNRTIVYYYFQRTGDRNVDDIAKCAALAFHKALIGISELTLLEEAGVNFRFAKPIQAYYAVYHLFVCNMLLDDSFEIQFKTSDHKNTYEVDASELNSDDESPDQWNKGRNLEQDLASLIQHADIRRYCKKIRDSMNKNKDKEIKPYTKILYKYFIKFDANDIHNCIPGLYEKMDYVRDRAVYRPTYVIYKGGTSAQTSYHVRKEIESLPTSRDIYKAVFEFYKSVLSLENKTSVEDSFITNLFTMTVNCSTEYANELGYTWDILKKMNGNVGSVPAYLCQMMEVFEPRECLRFFDLYWKEIWIYWRDSLK